MNLNTDSDWFQLRAKKMDGSMLNLDTLRGRVVLVVNVASKCGFTPQYKQLQELYDRYGKEGLSILAFPCNQFGGQEPGTDEEILQFCSNTYGVTFPVMSKVDVNGTNADPIFSYVKQRATGVLGTEGIKWNFTKFLIDQHGNVVSRFAPTTSPATIASAIEGLLRRE